MKVTFLGTGTSQGIPIIGSQHPVCLSENPKDKRLRVSVLIEWDSNAYVIDCGPDFRQQMLANKVSRIDGILFTHEHADHIMGLDDIRPFFFRQGNIPIYAHERVLTALEKRFDYIFQTTNRYPGAPSVTSHVVVKEENINLQGLQVVPIDALHGQLQIFGYRFGKFAYLTDIKSIDPTETKKLQGIEVLVINALREEPHHSHLCLQEALDFIKIIQPGVAYLTHISHHLGFHDEVSEKLPKNVHLAYDNLSIQIS